MNSLKEYTPTLKIVFALILLTIVIIFAIQNSSEISLSFMLWSTPPVNTSLVLFATLFAGIIIGLVFSLINMQRRKKNPDFYNKIQ